MNLSEQILNNLNRKKLCEHASVGITDDNFEVYIETDTCTDVPYFVYSAPDRDFFCTTIRIDKAEYTNEYIMPALNRNQREKLVEFLKQPDVTEPKKTRWQVLLIEWNRNNPNYKVDTNLKTPDYLNL